MLSSNSTPGYLDDCLRFTADELLVDFSTFTIQAAEDDKLPAPGTVDVPFDILQSIYTCAIAATYDDPELVELRIAQATVVSCAQVCRTWRAAALAQKELWAAMVDFQGQSVTRLCHLLKVSAPYSFNVGHRSAPVSFTGAAADPRSRDIRALLRLLQEHQARIRELHVDWFSVNKAFVVHGRAVVLSQLQLPRLEVVTWGGGGPVSRASRRMESDGSESPAFPIFPALPHLRRVVLYHSFGLSDPLLSQSRTTLTELSISSPSTSHRMSVERLANVLRTLKRLELLSLSCVLEKADGGPTVVTTNLPLISLPHLVYMSLSASQPAEMDSLTTLLSAIIPSQECGLQLLLPYLFLVDHFRQSLLDCLLKLFGSSTPSQERGKKVFMLLNHEDPKRSHCTLSNISPLQLDSLAFDRNGKQSVLRSLASLKTRPLTVRCMTGFHALHYLGRIWPGASTLEINSTGIVDSLSSLITHIAAYSALLEVTNLVLHENAAEDALRNILTYKGRGQCLNKLESITLVSCECTPESDLFQLLAQILAARQTLGVPIRQLSFTRCVVSKDDLRDFARLFDCDIYIAPGPLDSAQNAQYTSFCNRDTVV